MINPQSIRGYAKGITCLVILAFLVQVIFPVQFHLHHVDEVDSHVHKHVVDSHIATDSQLSGHLEDDEVSELKVVPDVLVKLDSKFKVFAVLLAALYMLALSSLPGRISRLRASRDSPARLSYYHLAPPLRAPPAVQPPLV